MTYVSASNPSGVDSSLKVYVNDVKWHETAGLVFAGPGDRQFATTVDNEDTVSLVFGNGINGARLPTGAENIRAEYRAGIGKPGNVRAEQISLLKTKPLGVKEVINPLRASGGADRETGDQARKNAPLAIMALDRLVSVRDYEDFSRTYAGIGKAVAAELSDGRRQLVHVTIAGADDIPIETHSDLFRNLRQALLDFGDPYQPLQLAVRELMMIVLSAQIRIHKDHVWEVVVEAVRERLLDQFGFERRELGQGLALSAVISSIQSVRGVEFVDVEAFGGVPEKISKPALNDGEARERRLLTPEEIAERVQQLTQNESGRPQQKLEVNMADYEDGEIRPAQIAFLNADVPETLILNQLK